MPWVSANIRGKYYTVKSTTFVPPRDQWDVRGWTGANQGLPQTKTFNEIKDEYGGVFLFGGYWEAGGSSPYLILNPRTQGQLGCFTVDIFPYATHTITYRASNKDYGVSGLPGNTTKTWGSIAYVSSTKPTKTAYTVSFNSSGGSAVSSVTRQATFDSWRTNADQSGTRYTSGQAFGTDADTTLYTVFNNPTLGSVPSSNRTGYTFNGWYLNGSKTSSSTVISGNCTLVANWTINKYDVYYDAGTNGGTVNNKPIETISYDYNTSVSSLPTAFRKGYKFLGWFDKAVGGNQVTSFTIGTSNRTLYAQFKVDASVKLVLPNGEVKSGSVYIKDSQSNTSIKGTAWVKTDSVWKRGIG